MTSAGSRVGLLVRALVILVGALLTAAALPTFAARADTSYVYDGATQLSRPMAAASTSTDLASLMMRSAVQEQSPLSAATGFAAEDGVPLFRQGAAIPGTGGPAVEPTLEAVQSVASRAGADLRGIKITINQDEELLGRQLYGHTPDVGNITLYPDAFTNEESMAATLGHELNHVYQLRTFGPAMDSEIGRLYENASYAVEQSYLDYFRLGG